MVIKKRPAIRLQLVYSLSNENTVNDSLLRVFELYQWSKSKGTEICAVHTMYVAACSIGQIDNKMYIYPVHITKTEETHEKNRDEVNWINE